MEPFIFMTSVEAIQLTGRKAASLLELYLGLKEAEGACLYHHTHRFYRAHSFLGLLDRSDFADWISQNLKEDVVAERMATLDLRDYQTMEELRPVLLAALETLMEDKHRWTRRVPPGLEFHFCKAVSLVFPTGHQARNLEEFIYALERVDISCIYYHLIEAPLHLHGLTREYANDFSQWLGGLGFTAQARALAEIDPYQDSLESVRQKSISVFLGYPWRAAARRVAERITRDPSGEAAAAWLRRWREDS
jgi:hypothetical protein